MFDLHATRVFTFWRSGFRDPVVTDTPTELHQYLVVPVEGCPEAGHTTFTIHALVDREETELGHFVTIEAPLAEAWQKLEDRLDALHANQGKRVQTIDGKWVP